MVEKRAHKYKEAKETAEGKFHDLEREKGKIDAECLKLQKDIQFMRHTLAEKGHDYEELEQEVAQAKNSFNTTHCQLAGKVRENIRLEEEVEKKNRQTKVLEKEALALQQQLEMEMSENSRVEEKIVNLDKTAEALEKAKLELKQQLRKKVKENTRLELQVEEYKKNQEAVDKKS